MKIGVNDLSKLRFSLLAALLMSAAGAAAVYASLTLNQAAIVEKSAARTERNEFDGKLKRVRNEESEIKLKSAIFNTLQTQGIIGDEQRLEWVELLKSIRDKRRLFDLQYEIEPQRPLDAGARSGLAFFASAMKIQLKLLHEEDLTRFIDDLRRNAPALILVNNCNVSRLPQQQSAASDVQAHLLAECRIDWITIH